MDEDDYRSIAKLEDIMQYIDDMDGFRDFPVSSISYDDEARVLTVGIEEVIEGEDWPKEGSGRVWSLNFGDVDDVKFELDVPLGFWISDIYTNDDGSITIDSEQGNITVVAGSVELSVPVEGEAREDEGGQSFLADKAEALHLTPRLSLMILKASLIVNATN